MHILYGIFLKLCLSKDLPVIQKIDIIMHAYEYKGKLKHLSLLYTHESSDILNLKVNDKKKLSIYRQNVIF